MRTLLAAALTAPSLAWGQTIPTSVLWYRGNGGIPVDSTFVTYVTQPPLSGDVFEFNGDLTAIDLDEYRFVVIARPQNEASPAQVAALQDYLAGGGLVVIAGEADFGGAAYVTAINALLEDLGLTMRLESYAYSNPLDPVTSLPLCNVATVATETAILPGTSPFSVQELGDINPGLATVMANYLFNDPEQGQINAQFAALEGRVVLTADGDLFTGDTCGANAKQVFWNGLWTSVCDLDEDNVQSARCGGQDCFDDNPAIGAANLYADRDEDGFGNANEGQPCGSTPDVDAVSDATDCDDTNPDRNPDATEVCNGIDDDCDEDVDSDAEEATAWVPDFDNDGFGRIDGEVTIACEAPANHVEDTTDCDDADGDVFPGAPEACNNGQDDDCDDVVDEGCTPIDTDPDNPPGKTCGCASAAGAGPAGLLVGLLAALRRRRAG